jgi:hypothetical protein
MSEESKQILAAMNPDMPEKLKKIHVGEFPDYIKEAFRKDPVAFAQESKLIHEKNKGCFDGILVPADRNVQTELDLVGVAHKPSGSDLIAEERQRQMDSEGWTAEHDDQWVRGELLNAAICYADYALGRVADNPKYIPLGWPWDSKWWKPTTEWKTPETPINEVVQSGALWKKPATSIRDLMKAGALIAAEIDRLQRLEEKNNE